MTDDSDEDQMAGEIQDWMYVDGVELGPRLWELVRAVVEEHKGVFITDERGMPMLRLTPYLLNASLVGRWESGEEPVPPHYVPLLEKTFGMSAEELGLTEEPQ
jgi:hypothetical protein